MSISKVFLSLVHTFFVEMNRSIYAKRRDSRLKEIKGQHELLQGIGNF